jgi:hypothetical protein
MEKLPIRQHIDVVLDQLSPTQLSVVADFVDFLKTQTEQDFKAGRILLSEESSLQGSTAKDLLEFAGTWEGDDLRECLQIVSESRALLKF